MWQRWDVLFLLSMNYRVSSVLSYWQTLLKRKWSTGYSLNQVTRIQCHVMYTRVRTLLAWSLVYAAQVFYQLGKCNNIAFPKLGSQRLTLLCLCHVVFTFMLWLHKFFPISMRKQWQLSPYSVCSRQDWFLGSPHWYSEAKEKKTIVNHRGWDLSWGHRLWQHGPWRAVTVLSLKVQL